MYQYNPNLHVKIWLSNNPNLFLNLENRVRLIEMREKNPLDKIHFIFDSTLLIHESINALYEFCAENSIIPIDAHTIKEELESEREQKLYQFYLYIAKSKEVNTLKAPNSSLKIRAYINEVMTDKTKFLNFNKISPTESDEAVIKRLRKDLQAQLGLIKFVFFNTEYSLIKCILEQDDEQFLSYLMEKERDLYLKSIVVCTTGPIEVSKALFNAYVVDTTQFMKEVQPLSFNYYGLQKAFRSQNSIPLHENVFGMLKFLGEDNGKLNDSSWLYSGSKLQASRIKKLVVRQEELALSLPDSFTTIKYDIEEYLQKASKNFLNKIFFKTRNKEKISTFELILSCFNEAENTFDINQFKNVILSIATYKKDIYAHKILEDLENLCTHISNTNINSFEEYY
ncbi:MAG: hypothetical protein HYX60_02565 [Legionella longbeachae]|nr:hypothetical protein [Legionella longbeachae]